MGSEPDTQVTEQTSGPPKFVEPYSKDYLKRASDLSNTAILPELPSGAERTQGFSQDQLNAFDAVRQRAASGDPTINQASAGLGQFLDPNAAFSPLANQLVQQNRQATIDDFNTSVAPSLASRDAQSGSFGNTGVAELDAIQRYGLGRSLGETEANVRNSFLDRSLAAQSYAPGLAASRAADISALSQAGAQQQGLGQSIRDIDFQNLLSKRDEPFTRLNVLGQAINTASGGYGNTTSIGPGQQQQGNPFLSGLGALGSAAGGLGQLYSSGIFGA